MQRQLKRITGLFLIIAAILVGSVVVTYLIGLVVIMNNRTIISQLEMNEDLRGFYNTVLEAESGQRGFLLTGDDKYLSRYHTSLEKIGARLEDVDDLGRDGRIPAASAAELHHLTQQKIAELEKTIALWREQGPEAAMKVVQTGEGEALMGKIYDLIHQIETEQQAKVLEEQKAAEWSTTQRNIVFTLVAVINLLFLGWMYRRVSQEMHMRERALASEQEQRELLMVTLRSIGDAVIVTDTLGQVTFMNEVAQQLTGHKEEDARGKPISEVFRIISEETRQTVESPVQKVLREGMVVGLANHTLLLRSDGSELPIDDSGAPVRDRMGRIHGVVLVFRDFSDHKKHETELLDARKTAESASTAKDQFMAALSHELRTPLTPVLAMLTNWETGGEMADKYHADLQMMRRNVELEARLIDDLLDLTRVVKGKLTINVERSDVHDILRHVMETCRSETNAKHVHVDVHLDARNPMVMADPARLQQIFWNILRNAAKFSPDQGEVRVSTADAGEGMLEVDIADHGIGMDREVLERLFRPFEQGGPAITRRYGGLGMGLAISKALVDMQGGSLVAESEGPGKGSLFKVKFPQAQAGMKGDVAAPADGSDRARPAS